MKVKTDMGTTRSERGTMGNQKNGNNTGSRIGAAVIIILGSILLLYGLFLCFAVNPFVSIGFIILGGATLAAGFVIRAESGRKVIPESSTVTAEKVEAVREPVSIYEEHKAAREERLEKEYDKLASMIGFMPAPFRMILNPLDERLDDVGPDGLKDESGITCWIAVNDGGSAGESETAALLKWKQKGMQEMEDRFDHSKDLRTKRYIKFDFYLITGTCMVLLPSERNIEDLPDKLVIDCLEAGIHFFVPSSQKRIDLIDLSTKEDLILVTQEWPGSADDAATYGSFDFIRTPHKEEGHTE